MKTIDRVVLDLCEEIDYWKEQAKYWKTRAEELQQEQIQDTNKRYQEAMKGIANGLSLALAIKEDVNGNLIIDKESREELSKTWNHD